MSSEYSHHTIIRYNQAIASIRRLYEDKLHKKYIFPQSLDQDVDEIMTILRENYQQSTLNNFISSILWCLTTYDTSAYDIQYIDNIKHKYRMIGQNIKEQIERDKIGKEFELTDKEKKLIDSTLIVIDSLVYNYPEEKSLILKSISFLSFSLSALRYATQSSQNNQESYLITTTNQPFKKELSPLFNYTPFVAKEIERIRHAEWLTGIWYDPVHIDNSIDLFTNLNAFRANKLKFYISTYGMNFEELINKLSKEPHNEKLPVSGIIYDVS
jgi:hypothetical protein